MPPADANSLPVPAVPALPPAAAQGETPYLDALASYAERDAGRYHVPGHKGGLAGGSKLRERMGATLALDIPACTHGIDIGSSPAPLQQAEQLAAEAWGAGRTWFLVNGASEGNHAACLALAQSGDRVVVQRNAHSSTMHALVTAGLQPTFVAPEIDPALGIAHCATPESLDRALQETPEAVAAMVVSPTYFGAVADVRSMAEVAHRHGVPLVVDEAWGAHLHFHDGLPEDALAAGADLVISGTHKIVGSLTQSAMLHLAPGASEWIDEEAVGRALALIRSTSPNSLLLGSLDAARREIAVEGRAILDDALRALDLLRDALRGLPGLDVLDEGLARRPGVHAYDLFRLVVDVRGAGVSGFALARVMRELADINLELVQDRVIVAQFGLGGPIHQHGLRLLEGFALALERLGVVDSVLRLPPPADDHPPAGPLALSPREAFLAPSESVPFEQAAGRISAESVVVYPPGIPNVLPGERITPENLRHLRRVLDQGGAIRGTADPSLARLRVVR